MKEFDVEILASAIFWVPYTILLAYLSREHVLRTRNIQSAILALLALGSTFRCIWFFCYFSFVHYVVSEVINRVAMLFQFSGLSLLMYMWVRAISIAKLTDTAYNETSKSLVALSKEKVAPKDRKSRVMIYQEASEAVLSKMGGGESYKTYTYATVVANAVTWCFVLSSLAIETKTWYNINIISISIACLVLAMGTLVVGLQVSLALHQVLSPVYMNTEGATGYRQDQTPRCVCMGRYGAGCETLLGCCGLCSLYAFIFNYRQAEGNRQGLQMQREVLKVILSVSTITSFFFLIRSFVFLYRPVVKEYAQDGAYASTVDGTWAYPFFYYQVPELVPNLVIALGISPPNGILRHWYRLCVYGCRVALYYLQCCCCCLLSSEDSKLQYPQHSAFSDASTGAASPTAPDSSRPARSESSDQVSAPQGKGKAVLESAAQQQPQNQEKPRKPRFVGIADEGEEDSYGSSGRSGDLETGSRGEREVVSPVHSGKASWSRSGDIKISLASSSKPGDSEGGGVASFQVTRDTQGSRSSHGNTIFSVMASSLARSSAGGEGRSFHGSFSSHTSGGSPRISSKGKGGAPGVSLRRNAARGTWEAYSEPVEGEQGPGAGASEGSDWDAEEDAWARERRDSADIAEVLYRINSFSTGSEAASSLTNSHDRGALNSVDRSSVDSNTIMNSRRAPLRPSFLGGNRSAPPGGGGTATGKSSGSWWGWFR